MKHTKTKIAFLFSFMFLLGGLQAQTLKAFVTAAENAIVTKDYYSALTYYNNALEFDSDNIDIQFKSAEASRLFNAYTRAEERYEYVVENDTENAYPLATFWLADIKQKKGKYEEAKYLYELYLSEAETDDYFAERTAKELKACEWAIDVSKNPDKSVTIEHLGDGINSPYSEFAGLFRNDELYFSSLRYEKQNDVYNPKRLISKILKSEDQTTGEILEDPINDNEMHIAHATFSTSGDRIYYTECDYVNTSEIRCNIFYKNIMEDGSFGESIKLPDHINGDNYTSSQPSVGRSFRGDKDVLFFVSDRQDGKGKMDIWYTEVNKDQFSNPVNLKAINTMEDDITPYYDVNASTLYFSSEGYKTLGGFDIFKSYNEEKGFTPGEHLPMPVNSSYHDIYYSIDAASGKAHFSSNREGSYYLESAQEACCYDIYSATYEEVRLKLDAQTFDQKTLAELTGVKVTLKDKHTGEIIGEVVELNGISHEFDLDRDRDYIILAEKAGYIGEEIEFTTKGLYASEDIVKKLFLKIDESLNKNDKPTGNPLTGKSTQLKVFTYDGVTNANLNGSTVKLIDVATGKTIGKDVYNPNSNLFQFELEPCKKYRIIASKNGYDQAMTTITADCNGNPMERKLFLGSGAGIYLPLTLYFDNDIPDLRSVKTYTNETYTSTYDPYIVKKEEFKSEYSKPLKGEQRNRAQQDVDAFFEFDVKGGYGQLNAFLTQLTSELNKGRKIEISIKGYASPRASSKYNLALSKRRIHSLKNELVKYQNGILAGYIVSEQLKVIDLPFGENKAPSGISDQYRDRRNSVYSVAASRERRIEILGLNYVN